MRQRIWPLMGLVLLLIAPGLAGAQDTGDDIRRIARSVVFIGIIEDGQLVGNGSGTIVEPTGLIYTNRHVIEDADDLVIYTLNDIQELPQRTYRASVVDEYGAIDFAVIQIDRDAEGNPIDPATLNLPFVPPSSEPVDIGERVRVFGYPTIGDGYIVVTSGEIVTIQNGTINGERLPAWYRTDTEFSGGNSGGLAINERGEFIGLPTWVVTEDRTEGKLGGILPIIAVQRVIEAPSNPPPSGTVESVTFTLINDSELTVCFVFISPTTSNTWGGDQLGPREVIMPGRDRSFSLTADTYDLRLLDCDGDELLDERGINLMANDSFTFGAAVVTEPPRPRAAGTGITVDCSDGLSFSNGVEFIIRGLPNDETLTATAIGLDGFDPVLAVIEADTGNTTCVDDTLDAEGITLDLPTTGATGSTITDSRLSFGQETGVALADVSIVVGGYSDTTGEFVLLLEGGQLLPDDRGADAIAVRLTPSLVESASPLTIYMAGGQGVDPLVYLADPGTLDVFVTTTGEPVVCDDAGSPSCWGVTYDLRSSRIATATRTLDLAGTDSMLQLPLTGLEADSSSYITFMFSSFQQASLGDYTIAIQGGIGGN